MNIFQTGPEPSSVSIPIPLLEQVGDGELEAGQQPFAFEDASGADEPSLRERVADALMFEDQGPHLPMANY